MPLRRAAYTLALLSLIWPTEARASPAATARIAQPDAMYVGVGVDREARTLAAIEAMASRFGIEDALAKGMVLSTTSQSAIGDTQIELIEIRGHVDGIPLSWPVARALVDLRDGGRLRVVSSMGPVGSLDGGVRPRITASEALAAVEASGLPGSRGGIEADLVVVPMATHSELAWRVDPPVDREMLTNPVFFVDAIGGEVRVGYDKSHSALVRSFEHNPVVSPTAEDYEVDDIDDMSENLSGTFFRSLNCVAPNPMAACTPQHKLMADIDGNFLPDAPDVMVPADNVQLEDDFAEASLYYHADKFRVFLEGLGFPGIPCNTGGGQATLVANYRLYQQGRVVLFDNAFYGGDCDFTLVFGQGQAADFSYDGDIVYHEVGHGIVAQMLGMGFLGFYRARPEAVVVDASAMNEGLADFFSSSFAGDPVMSDYLNVYGSVFPGRDNGNDYVCPTGLAGQGHLDSEPLAAALYEGWEALGDPFIVAVMDTIPLLAPDAVFEELSASLETVTEMELGAGAAQQISDILVARGLDDCLRVVSAEQWEREHYVWPADWQGNFTPMVPPSFQFEFDVPEGADSMVLTFELEGWGPVYDLQLITKWDEPITFTYEEVGQTTIVDADSEDQYPGLNDGHVEVPVSRSGKLHGAFFNNQGMDVVILRNLQIEYPGAGGTTSDTGAESSGTTSGTTSDGETDTETDDDGTNQSGGDKGCGCRGGGANSWLSLLLGLGVACSRRRRRART